MGSRKQTPPTDSLLSKRGQETAGKEGIMMKYNGPLLNNKYDAKTNPQGCVNLGIAENSTCEDLLRSKIEKDFKFTTDMQYYFDFKGTQRFRESLAVFLSERLAKGRRLNPNQIAVTSGVSGAFEILAHFLADPGDCFLVISPCYSMFENDVSTRAQVTCHHVHTHQQTSTRGQFQFDEQLLEQELQAARHKGLTVRGLFISNPGNPTGDIFPPSTIIETLRFAQRHNLNVIVDEIFALTIFDEESEFHSVLSMDEATLPNLERIYVLWGFSKDFGLSGMRCGVIYSWNRQLLENIGKVLLFAAVPAPVQSMLTDLITDTEWLDGTFFPQQMSRMRAAHKACVELLLKFGATVHPGKGSCFIFTRLHKFMREATFAEEMALFHEFIEGGVNLMCGSALCCEQPGWFRLTYTAKQDELDEGLRRLECVLDRRRMELMDIHSTE